MPNTRANGITLEYETLGEPGRPAMLLVMGLGAQLLSWPDELCRALADRGFFVVRYDNRDVGLSTKTGGPLPDLAAVVTGDTSSAAYTMTDLAADGIGLLDALGIGQAHVVGVSMGGMIAQQMAIHHPTRLLSLCSIMSAPTGNLAADPSSPEATALLLRPAATSREEVIEQALASAAVIGSPGFPRDEHRVRERAARSYDRCFHPEGFLRQLVGILASGDWSAELGAVQVPTLVIHGDSDPLVRPSWGEATAKAISGSRLLMVPGMGHDLPEGAWPDLVEAIVDNAARAGAPTTH